MDVCYPMLSYAAMLPMPVLGAVLAMLTLSRAHVVVCWMAIAFRGLSCTTMGRCCSHVMSCLPGYEISN
jgi:hypothetical protein